MGAGLTKQQEYNAKRSGIRRMGNELAKAGVVATTKGLTIRGGGGNETFVVTYGQTLRASNGECFGNPHISVKHPSIGEEVFTLMDAQVGLDLIKALWGTYVYRDSFKNALRQVLAVRIETEFRKASARYWAKPVGDKNAGIFLHDANGNRLEQNGGEIFAYTEYRDGKVYPRLGTSSFPGPSYVEFVPGMTVRDETGKILIEYPANAI